MLKLHTFQAGSPRRRGEGLRIGTVRFLPRGVAKKDYARLDYFDVWFPTVAPSRELIRWFKGVAWSPAVQRAFFARYRRELLGNPDTAHALRLLAAIARHTPIGVGCYCEDESRCHRSVLIELVRQAAEDAPA